MVILLALVRCIFPDIATPVAKVYGGDGNDSAIVAEAKHYNTNSEMTEQETKPLSVNSTKFFDATTDICPNWKLATPDPMVTVGLKCEGFRVEMIIRSILTGSAWREYKNETIECQLNKVL